MQVPIDSSDSQASCCSY